MATQTQMPQSDAALVQHYADIAAHAARRKIGPVLQILPGDLVRLCAMAMICIRESNKENDNAPERTA